MPGMADEQTESPSPQPAALPVRAAWVAGRGTFERLSRVLQPLAVGLIDEVVDVVVLAPAEDAGGELANVPYDVVRYPTHRWLPLRDGAIEALAGELKRRKIDLLHALDAPAAKLTHRLAEQADLPYLLTSYSLDDAGRLAGVAAGAAEVLAASETLRAALIEKGLCPAERVRLMRPGVYHVRHPTCFDEPDHSVAIVAGGPLDDPAAFEPVLQCFAELAARKYDCVFFLIGSGPAERRLRHRAEQLGLRRQLTFVERQPLGQLTGILKSADVYISPIRHRELDMRCLLAMAAGVPVLAAAGDTVNDFLRDGETATFFNRADAAELIVTLTALLDDRASARALAASAIEYVHRNHSPAVNVTGLAHLCRQIVAGAP